MFDYIGSLFIPLMVVLLALGFVLTMYVISKRYKKIPPGKVGIFYGRKYTYEDPKTKEKITKGFKALTAGGKIIVPFVESYQEMETDAFNVPIIEQGIPNKDNVPINVKGSAVCKLSTQPEDIINAAENFLGKTSQEIEEIVRNILLGHNRSIIGNSSIEELLRQRDEYNKKVQGESVEELKRLGVEIKTVVMHEVTDALGYIEALGKRAVAEAKRDADIKVAEAKKESEIKVSNAQKESAMVQADNAAIVAESEKNRDIKKAQYKVLSDNEIAKSEKAMEIALVGQEKIIAVAQAEMNTAKNEAEIKVQESAALLKEKELNATIIKEAEAQREKVVIDAEASKKRIEIDAEAAKIKKTKEAEATANSLNIEAEAKKQSETKIGEGEAAKKLAIFKAEADGKQAGLLAEAEGKKQSLLADAAGKSADAEATEKLAKALKELDESGRMFLMLEKIEPLVGEGGDALAKVAEVIFKSVAQGISNVDSIHIVDMGGNGNGVNKMSGLVTDIVFQFFAKAKAVGFDVAPFLSKLGISAEHAEKLIGSLVSGKTATDSTTVEN